MLLFADSGERAFVQAIMIGGVAVVISSTLLVPVEAYQIVLKTNKDPNIMVDMATAAFKSGDNDLAEKSFKEALTLKPDHYNGLVNYGIFLANVNKICQALSSSGRRLSLLLRAVRKKMQIKSLISQAQSQLKTTSGSERKSNPNPAWNPTGK